VDVSGTGCSGVSSATSCMGLKRCVVLTCAGLVRVQLRAPSSFDDKCAPCIHDVNHILHAVAQLDVLA
jgi:hypothetical protein